MQYGFQDSTIILLFAGVPIQNRLDSQLSASAVPAILGISTAISATVFGFDRAETTWSSKNGGQDSQDALKWDFACAVHAHDCPRDSVPAPYSPG